jgi:hypothetical protein
MTLELLALAGAFLQLKGAEQTRPDQRRMHRGFSRERGGEGGERVEGLAGRVSYGKVTLP